MTTVTIHEAKTHLSKLIAKVLAGEEVTIARGKEKVAKLVPLHRTKRPNRVPGQLAHEKPAGSKGILDHGFWDPLSDEEMGLADRNDDPLSPNWRQ